MAEIENIPIDKLHIDPANIRPEPDIDPEFIDSVRKGMIENLVVRPHDGEYGVIIGSRRLTAAKRAELDELPCAVRKDLEGNDEEAEDLSLKENEHREDLPKWVVKDFVKQRYEEIDGRKTRGERVKEVASRLDISRRKVYRYLDISENLDSTLTSRLKESSERSEKEIEDLEKVSSEKLCSSTNEEDFDPEKEKAEGFPGLKKIPVEVAECLAKSDFFRELQEEDPEKAHEIATEAAEAGRKQAPKVITSWKKELTEDEEEPVFKPKGGVEKFMVTLGRKEVEALDRYAQEKHNNQNRKRAGKEIIFRYLYENEYFDDDFYDS